jgi:cyclopropane fatty-acyl-phospholipid synthase-like methyltransferase
LTNEARLSAPSALRNRDAILQVLAANLPETGTLLEIASGTGEHVVHFAAALPGVIFQPSDPDAERRESIDSWSAGIANIRPALALDVTSSWPDLLVDAVVCINMIHIAPWAASEGLIRGASAVLSSQGMLVLYGPYRRDNAHTAPSNTDFDADLRARNPQWGIRDMETVTALAAEAGFSAPAITAMPANNFCLVFRREA